MRLAGIDGCKGGWVAVIAHSDTAQPSLHVAPDLDSVMAGVDFALVDMPLGLVDGPAPRRVEPALRAALPGKASSVFPTPCRAALACDDYADASKTNHARLSRKLTKQTYNLFPKMRELDVTGAAMGQTRLREGHPEVSFALMTGAPLLSRKRQPQGRRDRLDALSAQGIDGAALLATARALPVAPDDVLDAAALLWSARRFRCGQHSTFPARPDRDARGLEMSVIA
jgi:predicted RNase H-like nuclease